MKFKYYRSLAFTICTGLFFTTVQPMERVLGSGARSLESEGQELQSVARPETEDPLMMENLLPSESETRTPEPTAQASATAPLRELPVASEQVEREVRELASKLNADLEKDVEQTIASLEKQYADIHDFILLANEAAKPKGFNQPVDESIMQAYANLDDHLKAFTEQNQALAVLEKKQAAIEILLSKGDDAAIRVARELRILNPELDQLANLRKEVETFRTNQWQFDQRNLWLALNKTAYAALDERREKYLSMITIETSKVGKLEYEDLQASFKQLREMLQKAGVSISIDPIENSMLKLNAAQKAAGTTSAFVARIKEQQQALEAGRATGKISDTTYTRDKKNLKAQYKRAYQAEKKAKNAVSSLQKEIGFEQKALLLKGQTYLGAGTKHDYVAIAKPINLPAGQIVAAIAVLSVLGIITILAVNQLE